MTLQEILASKRLGDIFILARYFYRIGEPIISDQVYEKIVAAVKHFRPENLVAYLDRTYDDDPVPVSYTHLDVYKRQIRDVTHGCAWVYFDVLSVQGLRESIP